MLCFSSHQSKKDWLILYLCIFTLFRCDVISFHFLQQAEVLNIKALYNFRCLLFLHSDYRHWVITLKKSWFKFFFRDCEIMVCIYCNCNAHLACSEALLFQNPVEMEFAVSVRDFTKAAKSRIRAIPKSQHGTMDHSLLHFM